MKHAKGYKEYARLDGLPRHSVFFGEYDSNGEPLCGLCTYPIVGYHPRKENKQPKTRASNEEQPQ